jgi:Putative peptidoglycan binding domain
VSDDKVTPTDHDLRPGDHLSRVAGSYRFRSYGPLWNDAANAAFRHRRPNPHILAAGESVHVPELNLREVDRPTEARHRFRAELHPLVVRLARKHWDGTLDDRAPAEIHLDDKPVAADPGGPGELAVPVGTLDDRLTIRVDDTELTARIGFLQPIDTLAGVRDRLTNLGYRAGDADRPDAPDFRSAVEEFQCDHGLVVDGKVGPVTRAALAKAHGC